MASFFLLVWISRWIEYRPVKIIVGSISNYSYAIFLVHHLVIKQMFAIVPAERVIGSLSVYVLFFVDILVIAALSYLLQRLNKGTMIYVRSMFTGFDKTLQKQAHA